MWLNKVVRGFERILKPLNWAVVNIGSLFLALAMFLTAVDVALRNLFNAPLIFTFELTQYMMSIMISVGIVYSAIMKTHINADVLVSRLSPQKRAIIDTITTFASVVVAWLAAWQSFIQMQAVKASGNMSPTLPIPIYPFIAVVAFAFALIGLVLLKDFLELLAGEAKT